MNDQAWLEGRKIIGRIDRFRGPRRICLGGVAKRRIFPELFPRISPRLDASR